MPRTEAEVKAAMTRALQHSRYARARARIQHIVDTAPPLSAEMRAELARILLDADSPPPADAGKRAS